MTIHTTAHALPDNFTPLTPEKSSLVIGHLPLTDSASLVIAKEKGFFAEHGLQVGLQKEPSWANIRDKLACGLLDAAHMLAPMPLESSLGLGPVKTPLLTALSLSLNGNSVTFSSNLYGALLEMEPAVATDPGQVAPVLKQLINSDRQQGKPALVFAHVYPFSCHHYELRYWLASAGIDPDHDVRLVVIPPQQVVESMRFGHIDGFCVGEPWNTHARDAHIGNIVISGHQIWNNAPEKVLGVTQDWADRHPDTHSSIIQAVVRAAIWLDVPDNRVEAAEILADGYIDLPVETLTRSLLGSAETADIRSIPPGRSLFYRNAASFPWISHAEWLISQMRRWKQLPGSVDIKKEVRRAYRPDIYISSVAPLGLPVPESDRKIEGMHEADWSLAASPEPITMASDRFIDSKAFDPDQPY